MIGRTLLASVAAATMGIAGQTALAQSSSEANGVQFNFASPGARSLGIGGAFVGLADDATSVYTNPAGLVNVHTPELSGEVRAWQYISEFPVRGHAFGKANQEFFPGKPFPEDTIDGIQTGTARNSVLGVSFASVAYPFERWTVAAYRHKIADFKFSSDTKGVFYTTANGGIERLRPAKTALSVEIMSYGVGAGYSLLDNLAVGLSVARYELQMSSRARRFSSDGNTEHDSQTQNGASHDFALSGGVLWQLNDRVTVGAAYHQASSFAVKVSSTIVDRPPSPPCRARFNVPDVAAVGGSFFMPGGLRLTVDYDWVRYSRLTRHFVTFNENGSCEEHENAPLFSIPDSGEIHLGFAKVFPFYKRSIIVSTGWWNEPRHALEYAIPTDPLHILFNGGRSDQHYTVGLGLNIDKHNQLYVAFDRGRRQRTMSASAVVRF